MLYSDCFFTASLIDMIVLETNHYATEMLPKAKTVWFDVTADNIMCFLALFILMGNVQKPKMQSYWTTDAMNATPFLQHAQCSHCKRCISYSNSVRLSVCLSVTHRYCVKTTTRSTVQFAPLDSKMCLVL